MLNMKLFVILMALVACAPCFYARPGSWASRLGNPAATAAQQRLPSTWKVLAPVPAEIAQGDAQWFAVHGPREILNQVAQGHWQVPKQVEAAATQWKLYADHVNKLAYALKSSKRFTANIASQLMDRQHVDIDTEATPEQLAELVRERMTSDAKNMKVISNLLYRYVQGAHTIPASESQ
jgi:hypothetical protein